MAGDLVIVGIGNTIRGDDAVGIIAAQRLARRFGQRVAVRQTETAGMDVLTLLTGFRRAYLLDAWVSDAATAGTVQVLSLRQLAGGQSVYATHQMSIVTVAALARRCGYPFPERVIVFALAVEKTAAFAQGLSAAAEQAVATCVEMISRRLEKCRSNEREGNNGNNNFGCSGIEMSATGVKISR